MQPYTNPYYFQNNPYNQQMYNPMSPYHDRLAQLQAQYGQQPPYNQMTQQAQTVGLNGEIVDSLDVVKAKNVDMSGNVTFYPKSDMTEIYTKQLQADGTSRIVTYKAVQPEEQKQDEPMKQYVDIQTLNAMLGQLKAEILQGVGGGLSEIKQMIIPPEPQTSKRQRGGNQND